jgi:hypothetical protein
MPRGWAPATNSVTSGTNAGTNAASDAGRTAYIPRIPSFRFMRGPWLASVKSPRYYPVFPHASARRPAGAGWAPFAPRGARGVPYISPSPFGQQWRHVSAPRAYRVEWPAVRAERRPVPRRRFR